MKCKIMQCLFSLDGVRSQRIFDSYPLVTYSSAIAADVSSSHYNYDVNNM